MEDHINKKKFLPAMKLWHQMSIKFSATVVAHGIQKVWCAHNNNLPVNLVLNTTRQPSHLHDS